MGPPLVRSTAEDYSGWFGYGYGIHL